MQWWHDNPGEAHLFIHVFFSFYKVPVGTVVKDDGGVNLTSLEEDGDYFVAARGGAGGRGNQFFLSNINRAPTYAETGATGQDRILLVELRTMAHAGLVMCAPLSSSSLSLCLHPSQLYEFLHNWLHHYLVLTYHLFDTQ